MADIKCFAFVLLLYLFNSVESSSFCDALFCKEFVNNPGCTTPASHCDINNATHTGLRMPSPTLCNCCPFCLPLFGEGEHCSIGGPGIGTSIGRCGDGLTCALNTTTDETRCVRMTTPCHTKQDEYDASDKQGTLGMLQVRPICDGKGKFGPVQCVTAQTCFCQSEEGELIYGEAAYRGESTLRTMQCRCSRMHLKIEKDVYVGSPSAMSGPRCAPDGNFNPVQCIDRTCYCVDPITGIVINEISSINLDTHPISDLTCYDANLDFFPHYSRGEPPYNYTTPCLQERGDRADQVAQSIEEGYNVDFGGGYPKCYFDGTYGPIAQSKTGSNICVDNHGRQIGNYEAAIGTKEFEEMDCKCAVTTHIMGATIEKPICCKNGNFRPLQCRRGLCYCVDSYGRQITKEETDIKKLVCWTSSWKDC